MHRLADIGDILTMNNPTLRFNPLGIVLESNIKHWTKQSIECYQNGLNCKKCTLSSDIKPKCKMKPIVIELVKVHGVPKGIYEKELL